eukprot:14722060-Alexandrium_andersonii.AAC.1
MLAAPLGRQLAQVPAAALGAPESGPPGSRRSCNATLARAIGQSQSPSQSQHTPPELQPSPSAKAQQSLSASGLGARVGNLRAVTLHPGSGHRRSQQDIVASVRGASFHDQLRTSVASRPRHVHASRASSLGVLSL